MSGVLEAIRGEYPNGTLTTATTWNGAAFVAGLVNLKRPYRVVEVGANVGVTSAFLANAIRDNGTGLLLAYELDLANCLEARNRLAALWPEGSWEVVEGDFFEMVTPDPVDFAFIDIDPKEDYTKAYEALTFAPGAVIVAHDIDLYPAEIIPFAERLKADGWNTLTLPWERGFLVAVKS